MHRKNMKPQNNFLSRINSSIKLTQNKLLSLFLLHFFYRFVIVRSCQLQKLSIVKFHVLLLFNDLMLQLLLCYVLYVLGM